MTKRDQLMCRIGFAGMIAETARCSSNYSIRNFVLIHDWYVNRSVSLAAHFSKVITLTISFCDFSIASKMVAKKNRATKNKKKANDVYEVEKILQKWCEKKGQVIAKNQIYQLRTERLSGSFILGRIFDKMG